MARYAQDREDLLRDATAFPERIKLNIPLFGNPTELFAGFRDNGALSIYFGADPVYQFNSYRELRRAFVDDRLLKAEQGKLIRWQTQRTGKQVEQLSKALDEHETHQVLTTLQEHLAALSDKLKLNEVETLGQVPTDADLTAKLKNWLQEFKTIVIADSPGHC